MSLSSRFRCDPTISRGARVARASTSSSAIEPLRELRVKAPAMRREPCRWLYDPQLLDPSAQASSRRQFVPMMLIAQGLQHSAMARKEPRGSDALSGEQP